MEKWRADGGEEKLKAAKKAAKRAEKAASSPKKKAGGGKSSFTNSTKISVLFSYLHNVPNQTLFPYLPNPCYALEILSVTEILNPTHTIIQV